MLIYNNIINIKGSISTVSNCSTLNPHSKNIKLEHIGWVNAFSAHTNC